MKRSRSIIVKRKKNISLAKKNNRYIVFSKKTQVFFLIFVANLVALSFLVILRISSSVQLKVQTATVAESVFYEQPIASNIYDRNGTLLFRIQGDFSNSELLLDKEINNYTRAVFFAAEDNEFYLHNGINVKAIARCAIISINSSSSCGGSTITQQLVKIATKRSEVTLERKVDEALLSTQVEEEYSKEIIFEKYLNVTPYGGNIVGLKTASKYYFNISNLQKLTLGQVAALASIVNNPTNLGPANKSGKNLAETLKKLEQRRQIVLNSLEENLIKINSQIKDFKGSVITLKDIQKAKNEKIKYGRHQPKIRAGHFANYVISELQKQGYKKDGKPFTLKDLQTGGYRIYTSLDYSLQKVAEKYAKQGGQTNKHWNVYNAALMTTIPSTGEIITMAGSKNFNGPSEGCDYRGRNCKFNGEVNVLTSLQSPGSTNKPLGYLGAFDEGKLFPGSFLPDIPIKVGNYEPKNWDDKFLGVNGTTAKEMLRQSRNIPAIEVIKLIGVQKYLDLSRKFGYTTYKNDNNYGLSLILGGADVYPVEHAQAYGVFANGGNLVKLNPVKRIVDRNGKEYYKAKSKPKRVASVGATYQLNQTLLNLNMGVFGQNVSWDNRQVAGKTGTTENNKDSLLMLYSPDFVTLGWAGNNNNEIMNQQFGWPVFTVAPWLKSYMRDIGNTKYFAKKTPFKKPSNVYFGGGITDCYLGQCRGLSADWLVRGKEPARGDVSFNLSKSLRYKVPVAEFQLFLDQWFAKRKK